MSKIKALDVFRTMTSNGWTCLCYNNPKGERSWEEGYMLNDISPSDGDQYVMRILGDSHYTAVRAVIARPGRPNQLGLCGRYGVLWVDVAEYENDMPYSHEDLHDMMLALELAEENLLRIGIPFAENNGFHGRNTANKVRRNNALRRRYDLDRLELEDKKAS